MQTTRTMTVMVATVGIVLASACTRDEPAAPIASTPPTEASVPAPAPPAPPPPPRELPPDASNLPPADRDYLIRMGLGEPEAELIADLRTHPELIRCKGEAGGTFGFHDPEAIRILARDRAEAAFDDGHVQGRLDLSFTVRGGKIKWDVEKTECGDADRVADAAAR